MISLWPYFGFIIFDFVLFFSGEKATAEAIADAIADNRAQLVDLPATMDLNVPLPSKDCEMCDGSVSTKHTNNYQFIYYKCFHVN